MITRTANVTEMPSLSKKRESIIAGPRIVRIEAPCVDPLIRNTNLLSIELLSCVFLNKHSREVKIFKSKENAKRHVEKHMLHKNESYLWESLCPESAELIQKYRGVTCDQIRKVDDLQQLYTSYARVIVGALNCASIFGLVVSGNNKTFYLGLSGMFVVITNGCVRTAYFPVYVGECNEEKNVAKGKRERSKQWMRYKKAMKRGSGLRRIWSQGLKRSMEYHKKLKKSTRDYKLKKQLARQSSQFYAISFQAWKDLFNSAKQNKHVIFLGEPTVDEFTCNQIYEETVAA